MSLKHGNPSGDPSKALRCGARTPRADGRPCQAPAVSGKKRCRMRGAHSSEDGARSRAQPAERPRDGTTEGRRASELAAGLAWPPATAMAEEREEPAPVGVRVSRGHCARRTQRAARVHAHPREGERSADSDS